MKKGLLLSYLFILVDQCIKLIVLILVNEPIHVFSDIFTIVLRLNEGIAFSLPIPPMITTPLLIFIIIGGTILAYFHFNWENKLASLSFSLIFAGATGNLIDRIFHGKVIDFIKIYWWPVFNTADIFITIGAGLIMYGMIAEQKKKKSFFRTQKT